MHKSVFIVGSGPVGSLLGILLARQGYAVEMFEKREDPRLTLLDDGRSINLALSHRGIRALHEAGLENLILQNAIPMYGRMVHDVNGRTNFQPYGETGQYINSVSRGGLNRLLIEVAQSYYKIPIHFLEKCTQLNSESKTITFQHQQTLEENTRSYTIVLGADGAFSQTRQAMHQQRADAYTQIDKLPHGYKELTIQAGDGGEFLLEKNALHIWPREQFMLIALPNIGGSFTCTLFLPFVGENSFASLNSAGELKQFFLKNFPDALPLIKNLEDEFFAAEASFLATVHTYPWIHDSGIALIGDAAHAIVPFYGQGMNAGMEDARVLAELLKEKPDDWNMVLPKYQALRKPNADAIAELAMQNFIEMRDLVADAKFILRKKIERLIHQKKPDYLPLYSMVTFSDIPYADALQIGKNYDLLMEEVLAISNIEQTWETEQGWASIASVVEKFSTQMLL